jgi:hypothetical protein
MLTSATPDLAVYQDPAVRKVIREHHHEKVADVYLRYNLLTRLKVAEGRDTRQNIYG